MFVCKLHVHARGFDLFMYTYKSHLHCYIIVIFTLISAYTHLCSFSPFFLSLTHRHTYTHTLSLPLSFSLSHTQRGWYVHIHIHTLSTYIHVFTYTYTHYRGRAGKYMNIYTYTHIHIHTLSTYIHHTDIHAHICKYILMHSFSLSLPLSLSHTHTLSLSLSLAHSHCFSFSLPHAPRGFVIFVYTCIHQIHIYKHTRIHTGIYLIHICSFSRSLSLSLTRTLSLTHTHPLFVSLSHTKGGWHVRIRIHTTST